MLFKIFGDRVANGIWEMIIKHAKTCMVGDNKAYTYHQASNQASKLFNSKRLKQHLMAKLTSR